ncbi:hypothetical protein AMAG_15278 [Allomyces macrogynus ATCC 38327]|uniref:Leucine carboxyl methyltransferase 1 n=1 Tax=Allomyces macrogynus (strain ATCC 38327) TaxID=578462 RepID=A0A0L0T8H9_ALLM3|nr:hypothetical protein AMAG_15278 [Allomyces macrogynus ATCC 38327]|eukprot:KNE71020.1 hypothetical protein AMAG_15278 [Allomyces macrogynus ATCC 38327]
MSNYPPHLHASPDDVVRGTDDVAALSRLSAVQVGYMTDAYAPVFVSSSAAHAARRPPLINRGTFARIHAFDRALELFIARVTKDGVPGQVLSLGAGTDTRWMRFKDQLAAASVRYFEVDFPETVMHKISCLRRHRKVYAELLPGATFDGKHTTMATPNGQYTLLGGDLRAWLAVVERLSACGFDATRPTLVMAECVLVYVDPPAVMTLLSWIQAQLPSAAIVSYDHIVPDDAFGQMMLRNLSEQGIELPGIHAVPTVDAHRAQLSEFARVETMDMNEYWAKHVPDEEKARIAKLEIFDEIEEWILMGRHYCLSVAAQGSLAPLLDQF